MKLQKKYIRLKKKQRLYHLDIPLVGLSGGIASGKSSVAEIFKKKGFQVICADTLVKSLYLEEKMISFVRDNIPAAFKNRKIDFKNLRNEVFHKEELRKKLEDFIHPQLSSYFQKELKRHPSIDTLIYDVPLLFEKNLQEMMDVSICVYSEKEQLKKRLTKRDGIDKDLAEKMLAVQLPMEKKRQQADFVIENKETLKNLEKNTQKLIQEIFDF